MMKNIELANKGVTASLVIRESTIADDMRRGMLESQSVINPFQDVAEQVVASTMYPRCLGALVEGTIKYADKTEKNAKELSPAEFNLLPGELCSAWLDEVVELNPTWAFGYRPAEGDDEKKKMVGNPAAREVLHSKRNRKRRPA
jgi:hypothetical protein